MRSRLWIGWLAVAIGVCAVVSALVLSSTRYGQGFAFGFGAFIAFFGALSIFAHDQAPDHWGLVVVGLAMFTVPFVGNAYSYDRGASWTCWLAGGLAMILGGFAWTRDRTSTEYGITELGDSQRLRHRWSYWIGRLALVTGLAGVVLGIAFNSTPAGTAVVIGLGGLISIVAVWSLLASEPTHNFLTLAIAGFALFLSPWVVGFARDNLAWTAFVAGALATALGVVGYLQDERLDFAAAVRDDSIKRYREQFR
ncbi:SPW repeat protein [Mycolicibacterium neoaurum]|uniref:SPW repeat domain-containing protein n=1 Tax=Mycolicibacterium neoaurum TaxID=1795 RepID=UPI00248BF638|nr:SPW repeat protein [Mycolicibacterium neoaurum]WBP96904.1 SPW repeat protein [Mycolicibacterium neoaurum]WBS05947.1 SPW repeat protein [Mycolicibacterium neoaurum]